MLLIAAVLVFSIAGVLASPYWLGRAWTRDGFWQLRDDVYDEWMADGYESLVLGKFVNRIEVAIDQLPRLSVWTLLATHSMLTKIGRDEMSALFSGAAELAALSAEERERYDIWDARFSELVMKHLVFSSWSGIAVGTIGFAVTRVGDQQEGRAAELHEQLEGDSKRLFAAAGPVHC